MRRFHWDAQPAADYESLVRTIPDATLHSPTRSVVPLVDFFHDPDAALQVVGSAIRLDLSGATDLVFESALPVQQGRGNPSYTDLMVLCPKTSVAIEAKYTEPRYQTVSGWLGTSPEDNRIAVLNGWLSLINSATGQQLTAGAVTDLPYQLIHRAASACASAVEDRALVYLIFGDSDKVDYAADVRALDELLGNPPALGMHVLEVPLEGSPSFSVLTELWASGAREMADQVRAALLKQQLFAFGTPRPLYSRPRPQLA